jgi:hypothetical protein
VAFTTLAVGVADGPDGPDVTDVTDGPDVADVADELAVDGDD